MDLVNLMKSMSVNETEEYKESNLNVFAANINSEHTDIVFGEFSNKYMIIATQYEKLGSLLKVTVDSSEDNSKISESVYSVTLLFGGESTEQEAVARYIAEKLDIRKTLMIFLCLKNYSLETVKGLTEVLLNVPQKD